MRAPALGSLKEIGDAADRKLISISKRGISTEYGGEKFLEERKAHLYSSGA